MARAKVELTGSLTHTVRGRTFERGRPQIITQDSAIRYYQAQPEFSVTMIEPFHTPKGKPPVAKPAKAKAAPAPAPEADEDEADEEPEAEEADADEAEADEDAGEAEAADDEDAEEVTPTYKKADLEKMTAKALVELGATMGLKLNSGTAKTKLVKEIMKKQIKDAAAPEAAADE